MNKHFTNNDMIKVCKKDLCLEARGKSANDIKLILSIAISVIATAYLIKILAK